MSHEVTPEEIRERIGEVDDGYAVLGGGHANTNVRLGDGRILRIYRRDVSATRKEHSLLDRSWRKLRVPTVLHSGADFLILEYVENSPLEGSSEHGAAVGQALAEIHRCTFERAGFLGPDAASVDEPFSGVIGDFCEYVASRTGVSTEIREQVLGFVNERRHDLKALAKHPVLLHGDFKVSNLHWTTGGLPLVLDWEFAYAGPALADVAQLIRWEPPVTFCDAFADAYRGDDGNLPDNWRRWANAFDLFNLMGLLDTAPANSRRATDIHRRIQMTLTDQELSRC